MKVNHLQDKTLSSFICQICLLPDIRHLRFLVSHFTRLVAHNHKMKQNRTKNVPKSTFPLQQKLNKNTKDVIVFLEFNKVSDASNNT